MATTTFSQEFPASLEPCALAAGEMEAPQPWLRKEKGTKKNRGCCYPPAPGSFSLTVSCQFALRLNVSSSVFTCFPGQVRCLGLCLGQEPLSKRTAVPKLLCSCRLVPEPILASAQMCNHTQTACFLRGPAHLVCFCLRVFPSNFSKRKCRIVY